MAAKRKAVAKGVRFEVFKRDRFCCVYCGAHPPAVKLQIDHVTAVANGGGNDIDNLVTACESCNLGKSATPLNAVPMSLAEKAADVREREEQLAGYAEVMEAKRARLENDTWRIAETLDPGCSEHGINRDALKSISQFIERIGLYEVLDAAEMTAARKPRFGLQTFRYFCGICWNKARKLGN